MTHAPRCLQKWTGIACLCMFALCAPLSAFAQDKPSDPPVPPEDARFVENFSAFELFLTGGVLAGGTVITIFGEDLFGAPSPSMGTPSEDSVDWRLAHWSNEGPDPNKQWLGGIPDYGGYFLPAAAIGYYGLSTVGNALSDDFFMRDHRHHMAAYGGALGWTILMTNVLKLMVGRQRPYTVRPDLNADEYKEAPKERVLSFPSGHSAATAVTMAFLSLNVSDYLIREQLNEQNSFVQLTVGRLMPAAAAAGITWTVMYSRIKDQRHWLSDTIVGASIGTGFAALFYVMHFDEDGRPRKRFKKGEQQGLFSGITNPSLMPTFGQANGLSLGFQF